MSVECLEAIRTPRPTIEPEKGLYYLAAYADSDSHGVVGCEHRHQTTCSAAACISKAGGYVVAIDDGKLRALTESEEAQVQAAMCGTPEPKQRNLLDHLFIIMLVKLGLQRF
jgi:hypothetical protein